MSAYDQESVLNAEHIVIIWLHTHEPLLVDENDLTLIGDASTHETIKCRSLCNSEALILTCICLLLPTSQCYKHTIVAVADDLLMINDISVDESEDLPKILGPLAEEGPSAALGRAHQQPNAAFSPVTNKRQLLQTMKLAAPAIIKLQVWPLQLVRLCDAHLLYTYIFRHVCVYAHMHMCMNMVYACICITFSQSKNQLP